MFRPFKWLAVMEITFAFLAPLREAFLTANYANYRELMFRCSAPHVLPVVGFLQILRGSAACLNDGFDV